MEKRHLTNLYNLLDEVSHAGFATVPRSLLTSWFGQEKFTVGIRRQLAEYWEGFADHKAADGTDLRVASFENTLLLFRDNGLFPAEEPPEA
ncbi:hypothetical protein [Achromobacter xylosoxidans]|uniref:hypothetical protein n=1 Tax=Alcaligenes xylosoxydans xylosoxydans TaxID=85698 RepID=UPI001F147787|nr:hypothetical protein [Achromobacter xylosoxidans]